MAERKDTISFDEMDKMLEIIEEIPPCVGWFPTIEDLAEHHVKEDVLKYAPFLLWISEFHPVFDSNDEEEDKKQELAFKQTKQYISKLFDEILEE